MTRRDYVKFADLLAGELALANTAGDYVSARQIRMIAYGMADICAQDNPNFDRQRFYDAIGLVG